MEYLVVKLGGSVISPEKGVINEKLVNQYTKTVRDLFNDREVSKRMILVVGGGNASRMYREVALNCGEDDDVDQHRIGITATWLNSELIRSLIDDIAYKRVLGVGVYAENRKEGEDRIASEFQDWLAGEKPVLVSGGFVNGASTDFNTVLLASKIGVSDVYKLTDIDYVYTDDPKVNSGAKEIKDLSWKEYLRMFGSSMEGLVHKPSAHIPIDLLAAQLADENKVSCTLTNGEDPAVLVDIWKEKKIDGTLMHP